jgi:hypothetical protein
VRKVAHCPRDAAEEEHGGDEEKRLFLGLRWHVAKIGVGW